MLKVWYDEMDSFTECFNNFRSGIPATRREAKQMLFADLEVFYNARDCTRRWAASGPLPSLPSKKITKH
jgi:hypothetical protein